LKVETDCILCLFQRGYTEILEATKDSELRLRATRLLLKMLAENFKSSSVPAQLGTKRERLIKEVTGNSDPFEKKKAINNREAIKILPFAEKIVFAESNSELRFRKACLCAIVGNNMEFNIPGHDFRFDEIIHLIEKAEKDIFIDDISKAFDIAQRSSLILYLTDNAGEIAFDTLLVKELKRVSKKGKIIVAVKGKPVHYDATLVEAKKVGMANIADRLITIGTDTMGLIASECSKEFLKIYSSADLIVAKGMAYAETLTENKLNSPHLLLFRTKCMTVAKFFKADRHKNVAKLLSK
jgi:uncharacterized protein with ATP-grasp and redox domains